MPGKGATPQQRSAAARARLLAAASQLFYAEGVQSVGIVGSAGGTRSAGSQGSTPVATRHLHLVSTHPTRQVRDGLLS